MTILTKLLVIEFNVDISHQNSSKLVKLNLSVTRKLIR